jgi:hypothetical protein
MPVICFIRLLASGLDVKNSLIQSNAKILKAQDQAIKIGGYYYELFAFKIRKMYEEYSIVIIKFDIFRT